MSGNKYICKDHSSLQNYLIVFSSFPEFFHQKFLFALPLNERKHTNNKNRVVIILLVCCNITFICIVLIHSSFSGNRGVHTACFCEGR